MAEIVPLYSGEAQFRRYSDTSTQGQQVVFALPGREELQAFIGKEGKRFMMVVVEIGDDEKPVKPIAQPKEREHIGENCYWAVLRCKEPEFWAFLNKSFNCDEVTNEKEAADLVRHLCAAESRRELDENNASRRHFLVEIKRPYQRWLAARGQAWEAGA